MPNDLPRVLALLTARQVEVHPVSNAPTIVNVTDHLVCSRLPTSAPLAIFASLDGVAGEVPVGLRVFSPDGALLHDNAGQSKKARKTEAPPPEPPKRPRKGRGK